LGLSSPERDVLHCRGTYSDVIFFFLGSWKRYQSGWYVAEFVQAHDTARRLKFWMHLLKIRQANFGNTEGQTW